MKKTLITLAVLGFAGAAYAQNGNMPECTGPCSYQVIGDTSDAVDNSTSNAKQLNPSSNSNASGVTTNADQRLQQSNNTLGDATATARGNSTTIGATDNQSDASNYATNLGGVASNGDQRIGDVGNLSDSGNASISLADTLSGNTISPSASATGQQDQQQGIADSGNSTNLVGARGGDQGQDQGQGQQQANRGTNAQGQSSEIDASDNSNVAVDASDNSDFALDASDRSSHEANVDVKYLPPIYHQPPVQLASANMLMDKSACGPVMERTEEEVRGVFLGWVGQTSVYLGETHDLVPVIDPQTGNPGYFYEVTMRDGSVQRYGVQITTVYMAANVTGQRDISLWGSGSKNSGGAGAAGSSGMNRLIVNHQIAICDAGKFEYQIPVVSHGAQ